MLVDLRGGVEHDHKVLSRTWELTDDMETFLAFVESEVEMILDAWAADDGSNEEQRRGRNPRSGRHRGVATGAQWLGSAYNRTMSFAKWAKILTGSVFILIGVYLSLVFVYELL